MEEDKIGNAIESTDYGKHTESGTESVEANAILAF